jgi:DNA-directed RNA polymerase sigma subunit (sigma70/sigma32)
VFNSYLRFVVSTAEKLVDVYMSKHMYQPSRKTLIVGCINEGNKGLLQAIKQYHDKQRDSKFMSFSLQVSGHYMKRYIADFYNNL